MASSTAVRGKTNAVVAAASRILPGDRSEAEKARKRRQDWQPQAWDYYDLIGEVKYGCNFVGNSMSKLRIFAAEIDDPEDEPVATTNEAAIAAVERLRSPAAGHSEIMRGLGVNLMVVGECYLVGLTDNRDPDEEVWEVRSIDEMEPDAEGKFRMKDVPGISEAVTLTNNDFVIRIWTRHARFANLADSSLHGVLASCEEILILERAVRAAGKSRITGPGVLLVPSELSFGQGPDPIQDPGDGEAPIDPFIAELMTSMMLPIQDEGNASAVVPMVVRGAAEHLKEFRHVSLDRPIDIMLDTRTERALKRLAQGMDVPPEIVLGLQDVNHWTSWQIDEATFKAHIEPKAVVALDALTQGYLRPSLEESGVDDAGRYVIWYDATKLVVRPNRGEDAKFAHGEMAISNRALLRYLDFSDKDTPSEEELKERMAMKPLDAFVQAQLLQQTIAPDIQVAAPLNGVLGETPGPNTDTSPEPPVPPNQEHPVPPEPSGNPPVNPGPASAVTAAAKQRATDLKKISRTLSEIDRNIRWRIHTAADAAMTRALDRVGASLRSKAKKDAHISQVIATTPQDEVASVIGHTLITQLGFDENEILETAFDRLGRQVERWIEGAQAQALRTTKDLIPPETRNTIQLHNISNRETAVVWMKQALTKRARALVYDPHPSAPSVGEWDESVRVPFGIARMTVARAGGLRIGAVKAAAEEDYGMIVGGQPVGGIGTGENLISALEDIGLMNAGYVWVYGAFPRSRPFEAHEELDGTEFANFDDEVLANQSGWPEYAYYMPGDHDGCVCDFDINLEDSNIDKTGFGAYIGPKPTGLLDNLTWGQMKASDASRDLVTLMRNEYGLDTRWNGQVHEIWDSGITGVKEWACNIGLKITGPDMTNAEGQFKVFIHELNHSFSAVRDSWEYVADARIEEGIVEGLAQEVAPELAKKMGLNLRTNMNGLIGFETYHDQVRVLRWFHQAVDTAESPISAKEFFKNLLRMGQRERRAYLTKIAGDPTLDSWLRGRLGHALDRGSLMPGRMR